MERIIALRQEATALRALAERTDLAPIRDQLLDLAARCEALAGNFTPTRAPTHPDDAKQTHSDDREP